VIDRVAYFIATAGYVGRFPIAPGTAGSLAGLLLYALIRFVDHPAFEAAILIVTLVAGIWSAQVAERLLGGKDPGAVVIDEVLGILVTLAFLQVNLLGVFVGFLLFRVFDVVKPFPAARLEHLPGGYGVMLDDAMAGLYSHLAMRILVAYLPGSLV
jgi:phosphatidylglycerophosphatase A